MASEWGNRRMGESAKRRMNVKTEYDKSNGRIGETAKKAISIFEIWMFIKTRSKPDCVFMS